MRSFGFVVALSAFLVIVCAVAAQAEGPGTAHKQYPGDDVEVDITPDLNVEDVPPPAAVEGPPTEGTVPPEGAKPPAVVRPVGKATISLSNPKSDAVAYEGGKMTIRWNTTGDIQRVRLYYYGERTKLGGSSRGDFGLLIADNVPNTGSYAWTIPWVDAGAFRLRVAGLNRDMQRVASDERAVRFRPKQMGGIKEKTFILVSKDRQRLYYVKDGQLKRIHVISTALPGFFTPQMKPDSRDPKRGEMGKVFAKEWAPISREYQVAMPYWLQITQSGSHGIHATSPRFYDELGGPASHGCVRQHRADAAILYGMVAVGTPVYIY